MGKSWWVDVSRTSNGGKRRTKLHVAYDGRRIVKVKKLTDLPVAEGDEVFIDVMFPEILDDLAELLRGGVRVYLLTRLELFRDFRDRFGLEKNDESDAKILSMIPRQRFRELTLDEVEVRRKLEPLLERFEAVSKKLKTVRTWRSEGWKLNGMDDLEKELARMYNRLRRRIIKVARDELEMYGLVERELGLGEVCLATLLLCVDFSRGIQKIKGYARRYGRVRRNLANLAKVIYLNANNKRIKKNKYNEIAAKTADQKTALKKIQTEILKDLKRLWRKHFGDKAQGHAGLAA